MSRGKHQQVRVRKNGVVVFSEGVSLKRLSFAASIATAVVLFTTAPAHSASLPQMIATSAQGVASSMSSVGYCFRGVKRALRKVGITLTGGEAYMAKNQLAGSEEFQQVSINNLHVGDILVHGASARHPHGHIAVYLGNGKEASDHIGHLITGARYGGTTVWRVRPEVATATAPAAADAPVVAEAAPSAPEMLDVDAVTANASLAPANDDDAVANVPAVSPAPHPLDISADFSNAMLQVVQLAQSAQINIGQALSDAVGVFGS
jgi:hypothetical protein